MRWRRLPAGDRGRCTDRKHDPIREESFERDTHGGACYPILSKQSAHDLHIVPAEVFVPNCSRRAAID